MAYTKEELIEAREDFLKMLPLIPILLTLAGAFRLYFHYIKFNIQIFNYVELPEILLLFLNDIYGALFSAFVAQMLSFFPIDENFCFYIRQAKYTDHIIIRYLRQLLTSFTGLLLDIYLVTLIDKTSTGLFQRISVFIFLILIILNVLSQGVRAEINLVNTFNKSSAKIYSFYLWFSIVVFLYTFILIYNEHFSLKTNKTESVSTIILENEIIEINNKNSLVGRTKNYLFTNSTSDGCTRIIPISEVKAQYLK